ncbi:MULTISPECIES: universal stress protein [Bacillaceae]|uniref:Universal stress protein n=1 Tax=Evansella alkalicola TaxID=745819 RepID=A0ABS6JYJ9_9BACI|nr:MULTISPECIES: universal stress protein [Bacillaceae]MBU9723658.1 universal stress protein [Bacillus alkalicola]
MFTKLVLATDGSDHSHRAADKAIELAKLSEKASIEIIYVVDGSKSKSDVLQYGDTAAATKKREEILSVFKDKIEGEGISSRITVLHGVPAETIIKHVNENNYDCLVLGSRGRGRVQTMILGSVSHKVMKYVKAPVLMVK